MKRSLADTLAEMHALVLALEAQTGLRITLESTNLEVRQPIDDLTIKCWMEDQKLCARIQKAPARRILL